MFHRILAVVMVTLLLAANANGATIIDDEGQSLTFDRPYSRIISLYPAHTENLAALGCEDTLVGVGEGDSFPASINDKARFSYRDNPEKLLAARPDLILIRPMISRSQPELVSQLRTLGIRVVSLQPTSIDSMFRYWRQLGSLCGQDQAAEEMVSSFTTAVAELAATLPSQHEQRPLVYFEAIHAKMKTFDPDSISIYSLTAAGGRNIATDAVGRNDSNIAPYGKERLLARGEEIDVFLSQVGRMNRVTIEEIVHEPGFPLIRAIREKRVYLVDEEIVSRPTLRLVNGIRQIHAILYPSNTPPVAQAAITTTTP